MPYTAQATTPEPARADVDQLAGITVVEFGTDWCPHCIGAQFAIATALGARSDIAHIKVEDGAGKPLGRSYRVKLWPTLIVLKDGQEVARLVRPTKAELISQALKPISG